MTTRKVLIIPDTHRPFHDSRAYNLMLSVAVDVDPDEVVILGDYADFYWANFYGKNPGVTKSFSTEEEIQNVNEGLEEISDLFPGAKKVFIEGNHEERLTRYLHAKASELYKSISLKSVLSLRGWTVVPYSPTQLYCVGNSHLYARHKPYGGGTHCAYQTLVKGNRSMVFGHTHRIQEYQAVDALEVTHRAVSMGWLGDKTHPVMQYVQDHHQWSLGFGLVDVLPNKTFFLRTIHIIDYKCLVDGFLYEG